MSIRSKIETSIVIAALSIGVATAAQAHGFARFTPNAVSAAHVALPVHTAQVFRRAPLPPAAFASHVPSSGLPTLPGCTSQASCRTVTGGILNGRPAGGTGSGNGSPTVVPAVARSPGLPGTTATSGTLTHACAIENCGSLNTPPPSPSPRPVPPKPDPTGGGGGGGGGIDGADGSSCMSDRDCGILRQN
jgi:hypothetical protein